jgi:hypothetical protein
LTGNQNTQNHCHHWDLVVMQFGLRWHVFEETVQPAPKKQLLHEQIPAMVTVTTTITGVLLNSVAKKCQNTMQLKSSHCAGSYFNWI